MLLSDIWSYHLLPSKIGYTYAPILVITRLLTLKKITVLSLGVDLNHHLWTGNSVFVFRLPKLFSSFVCFFQIVWSSGFLVGFLFVFFFTILWSDFFFFICSFFLLFLFDKFFITNCFICFLFFLVFITADFISTCLLHLFSFFGGFFFDFVISYT